MAGDPLRDLDCAARIHVFSDTRPGRRGWFGNPPHTPVFEEAEIVAFLDSINLESLKDVRDKAIFSVLFYSWCRVSGAAGLYSTTPRIIRESKSNRTAARCCLCVDLLPGCRSSHAPT